MLATKNSPLTSLAIGGALLSAGATARPIAAVCGAWLAIVLVPVYWGLPLAAGVVLVPTTAAAFILLPAAIASVRSLRAHALDAAVAAFFLLQALAYLVNFEGGHVSAISLLSRPALGYAVVRLLSVAPQARAAMAWVAAAAGIGLALVALLEARGWPNPWLLVRGQFEVAVWAHPEVRFDATRAEASFGHPIALGMYFAQSMVLVAALAMRRSVRLIWLSIGALLIMGAAILATLSRTPLIAAPFGLVMLALSTRRRARARLLVPLACVPLALAVLGPAASTLGLLVESFEGNSQAAQSVEYRERLFALVTDPDQFSLLGRYEGVSGSGPVNSVAQQIGFSSFDNYFGFVYLVTGALPLAALLVCCALVFREATATDQGVIDRGWACTAATGVVGLTAVGLLAQHGDLFWLGLAVAASARQARLQRRERSSVNASFSEATHGGVTAEFESGGHPGPPPLSRAGAT